MFLSKEKHVRFERFFSSLRVVSLKRILHGSGIWRKLEEELVEEEVWDFLGLIEFMRKIFVYVIEEIKNNFLKYKK